jgi:hypothetical protein
VSPSRESIADSSRQSPWLPGEDAAARKVDHDLRDVTDIDGDNRREARERLPHGHRRTLTFGCHQHNVDSVEDESGLFPRETLEYDRLETRYGLSNLVHDCVEEIGPLPGIPATAWKQNEGPFSSPSELTACISAVGRLVELGINASRDDGS